MEYVLNMYWFSLLLYHYCSLDLSFITCQKKPGLDPELIKFQCACAWEACLKAFLDPPPEALLEEGVQKAFVTGTQVDSDANEIEDYALRRTPLEDLKCVLKYEHLCFLSV